MTVEAVISDPSQRSRSSSASDELIVPIKDEAQWDMVLADARDTLVVADFFATWCRKCVYLLPRLKKLAMRFPDVIFIKVNVNEVKGVPHRAGIEKMPTIQLYKSGRLVQSFVAEQPGEEVAGRLAELIEEMRSPLFVIPEEPAIDRGSS